MLRWLPRYSLAWLQLDLMAGLTVGLTAVPQALAYAEVAGLPLQVGGGAPRAPGDTRSQPRAGGVAGRAAAGGCGAVTPSSGSGRCGRRVLAQGWLRALEGPGGSPALLDLVLVLVRGVSGIPQLPALCRCSLCPRTVRPLFFLHGLLCLLRPGHRQGRDAGSHGHHVAACLFLRVPRACLRHPARLPLWLHPAGHGAPAPW